MSTPITWNTDAGSIRVIPARGRLLGIESVAKEGLRRVSAARKLAPFGISDEESCLRGHDPAVTPIWSRGNPATNP